MSQKEWLKYAADAAGVAYSPNRSDRVSKEETKKYLVHVFGYGFREFHTWSSDIVVVEYVESPLTYSEKQNMKPEWIKFPTDSSHDQHVFFWTNRKIDEEKTQPPFIQVAYSDAEKETFLRHAKERKRSCVVLESDTSYRPGHEQRSK